MKKLLSIILTILMIVTTIPLAFAAGDGTPLTIDLSEVTSSYIYIGNGRTYYDEDGYIITGTNTNVTIQIYDSCDITFSDMSAYRVRLYSDTEKNVTVTLDGDNYTYGVFSVYKSHLTINGDADDTLTIESSSDAFYTGGQPGTLTVNGGKINAVTETTSNYPTIDCTGGFTLNGGEVTASNNYYHVIYNKTIINGGTLNVIITSPNREAIYDDIEIAKGALLTVSATYKVIPSYYNITPVNEAEENLLFFARFDKDTDFSIVSDIVAALDGKTYAEIKVDTHEHDFDNSGKCACGYSCPHENFTDGKCVCGVERADYTAFDAAVEELRALLAREDLLDGPKQGYTSALNDVLNGVGYNRIEKEQMAVNNGTQTLNGYIAAIKAGIENDSMIKADFTYMTALFAEINELIGSDHGKIIPSQRGLYTGTLAYYNGCSNSPTFTQQNYNSNIRYEKNLEALLAGLKDGSMLVADYTEIDEAIKAIDEALENATISEEMAAALAEIKADLEALKADANTSTADLANSGLLARAEAITETMNNCANGEHAFTKYEETEAPKCGVAGKKVASCDHGCGATDEGEITALEHIFADYTSNGDATCEADGTKTAKCIHNCGETDTVTDEGSKLDHADEDGDNICDDCQAEIIDTCPECGRKAHGDSLIENLVCLIFMLIRLITSLRTVL